MINMQRTSSYHVGNFVYRVFCRRHRVLGGISPELAKIRPVSVSPSFSILQKSF